jgi:hypothetical protein
MMGTNVTPIFTKKLHGLAGESAKETLNLSGQFLLNVPKRMRLGVSTDFREDMFWIDKFNELCDTITIDI